MPTLDNNLKLDRCPHCSVANPHLPKQNNLVTKDHSGRMERHWMVYICQTCGGVVTAWSIKPGQKIVEVFPSPQRINEDIPVRPRSYLQQAHESLHAPAGAIMLAASAVDSMLKIKGLTDGSLYKRIDTAAEQNMITPDMATWAHEVRLEANDQRHADEHAEMPDEDAARRTVEFAIALADLLFVLPERVKRGINEANKS